VPALEDKCMSSSERFVPRQTSKKTCPDGSASDTSGNLFSVSNNFEITIMNTKEKANSGQQHVQ